MSATDIKHDVPLTPSVLRWARETSGLSTEDVAHKLKRKTVTSETIEAWERGEGAPTYAQLESLAYEVYRRPLALFFFPAPPVEETPKQAFRTLPESEIQQNPILPDAASRACLSERQSARYTAQYADDIHLTGASSIGWPRVYVPARPKKKLPVFVKR